MSDTKALKARIDILDVLKKFGAKMRIGAAWDDEVAVFCPFCEDGQSHKPAARANNLKGLYYCYHCGFGGDIISLVQRHLDDQKGESTDLWGSYTSSFEDTLAWLEENFPDEESPWTS